MQTIEQFGFSLMPSNDIPEEKYLEIKRGIEFVCRMTAMTAQKLKIEFAVFVFPNGENADRYPSVCFCDEKSYFGIYNKRDGNIETSCSSSNLIGFDESSFDAFAKRCHNLLHQMSRGREVNMGKLSDVWMEQLKEREIMSL